VIRSADDGTRVDIQNIRNEIRSESKNRILINQLATDNEYTFEYRNRGMLRHNHRGGILFTVGTPQEAARCMNLGIYLHGRKHRVFVYTRSRADDLCTHCSAWGHLERTCGALPRCGSCSGNHRTDQHIDHRNGKYMQKCPNCNGNHQVDDNSCKSKASAVEKQVKRLETPIDTATGKQNPTRKRVGKSNKRKLQRGAPRSSGPGRQ
jgi:hypothetical protein